MKIMKVVYLEYGTYESWNIGEFYTAYVCGYVNTIQLNEDGSVTIFVLPENGDPRKIATWIAPHAVQRIYYGEQ